MLAGVRPRDVAGKTRRRIAAEVLADLTAVDAKINAVTGELQALVLARGSRLMERAVWARWSRRGSWPTSGTSPGSRTATGSRPGPVPPRWMPPPVVQNRHRLRAGNRQVADAVGARLGLVIAWARVSELETSWNGLVETAIAGQEDERRRVAGELHGAG